VRTVLALTLAAGLPLLACGNDPSCSVSDTPHVPSPALNTGTRLITWSPVASATSYNLYLKVVSNCDSLDASQMATTSDQKVANASSPVDISMFNRCHTCYYYGVTAADGTCESAPAGGGFMLAPCV
jgi:hypothetical protein